MAVPYGVVLAILVAALGGRDMGTEACSCMAMHPQQYYCNSDMIVRGKIMRKEMMYEDGTAQEMTDESAFEWTQDNRPLHLRYTLKIKKMYKEHGSMNVTTHMYAITSPSSASCGVMGMVKSGTYVLSGNMENSQTMWINSCGLVREFNALTKKQRQGLKSTYGRDDCSCEIRMSRPGSAPNSADDVNWCPFWPYTADYQTTCEERYSACLRNHAGKCKWKKNKTMRMCMESLEEKPL